MNCYHLDRNQLECPTFTNKTVNSENMLRPLFFIFPTQASVTVIGSAPSRPNSSYIANRVTPSSERKASPLSQSNEQLDKQKKEAVKVKRKAPPPPPQQRRERPERPKSMPIPRPRTNESVAQGAPQSSPQAKKRQVKFFVSKSLMRPQNY